MINKDVPQTAQPIFVVGSPRSGTTLVGNYIGFCRYVCNLGEYAGFFFSHYTAVREYLKVPTPYKERYIRELQEYTKLFASAMAMEENCHYYCDSTPWNLMIVREIADKLPNAIFILTLRHYSGVIQSLSRSYQEGFQWAGASWSQRAEIWRGSYANVRFLPLSRTVTISYDRLCSDPENTLSTFENDLARVGLDVSELDRRQLAKSHATSGMYKRKTIGTQFSDRGDVLLRRINSFDPQFWSESIEAEVCPIVKNIDDQLYKIFPDSYMKPMIYSD